MIYWIFTSFWPNNLFSLYLLWYANILLSVIHKHRMQKKILGILPNNNLGNWSVKQKWSCCKHRLILVLILHVNERSRASTSKYGNWNAMSYDKVTTIFHSCLRKIKSRYQGSSSTADRPTWLLDYSLFSLVW